MQQRDSQWVAFHLHHDTCADQAVHWAALGLALDKRSIDRKMLPGSVRAKSRSGETSHQQTSQQQPEAAVVAAAAGGAPCDLDEQIVG